MYYVFETIPSFITFIPEASIPL